MNKFKEWRQANGLTQHQAADALGISRATVARYEAGQEIPQVVAMAMLYISSLRT